LVDGGDSACPPGPPLRLARGGYYLCGRYRNRGVAIAGGQSPRGRLIFSTFNAGRNFFLMRNLTHIMDPEKIYCPNCFNQIDTSSKECPRCFTRISHNLENFLLAKYKIFTLIGVFGALSIYLLTTSNQNGNDPLLLSGRLFSLTLVIILSGICIWDLLIYYSMKNEKIDYQNLSISDIFRNIRPLPSFILFAAFFSALIFILAVYVLSNKAANYSIISTENNY